MMSYHAPTRVYILEHVLKVGDATWVRVHGTPACVLVYDVAWRQAGRGYNPTEAKVWWV